MISLPYLAAVDVSGADARDFLHGQLSADIRALAPGACASACLCDPKGRVLDHLLVRRAGAGAGDAAGAEAADGFTVLLHAARAGAFVDRLRLFVLRSKVSFLRRDEAVLAADGEAPGPPAGGVTFDGPGGLRYALGAAGGAEPRAVACWRFGELERGMVWLDDALSGRHLPQMLGLDTLGSVNFRKGCYPGQEVVARARYLGQVKRLPALAVAEGELQVPAGGTVRLSTAGAVHEAPAEAVTAAACDGLTAVLLVVRERESLAPDALELDGRAHPLQRWATM